MAHWLFVTEIGEVDGPNIDLGNPNQRISVLHPPNLWSIQRETPSRKTDEDMAEFAEKCDFISRAINVFGTVIAEPEPFPVPHSWRDIC